MKLTFVVLLGMFAGCATTYSCKTQNLGKCQSVSEVYQHLKDGGSEVKGEVVEGSRGVKGAMDVPLEGAPVLHEPVVLRVLLNHWEDEEKDLMMGGYIFIKVKDAAWSI